MAEIVTLSEDNWTQKQSGHPQPMMLAGAGPLISAVWKLGNEHSGWRYRFDVRQKLAERDGHSELFQPSDLVHFVKLIQVLAAVITDDGCLTQEDRITLRELAAQLDRFLGGACIAAESDAAENHMNTATRNSSGYELRKGEPNGHSANS